MLPKKGENNKKNGNKYLAWAYVEAAQFARRYCVKAQSFYQSKEAKTKPVVAIKALSNKLSKASYYIMPIRLTLMMISYFFSQFGCGSEPE